MAEYIFCPLRANVGELWELVTEGFFPKHSEHEDFDLMTVSSE